MQKQVENPCIRCGKTRVIAKVWKEYVGKALLTHTSMVCPDPACQKIVEEENAARREKRELFINRRIKPNQTKPSQTKPEAGSLKAK